jgi:ABC-type transporter Mla subunit MlaD
VTDIIGEIAAASQEQTTGIDQVNRAVAQMDQVVQSNAAQTEQLSSTAQALSEQAAQLQSLVGRFRLAEQRGARTVAAAPAPPPQGPVKPLPVRPTRPALESELTGALAGNGRKHDGFEEF